MAVLTAFQLFSVPDAEAAVADVEAGDLWGVSLGTTTKAAAVGSILVVQSTEPRATKLHKHSRFYRTMDLPVPQDADLDLTCAMFYGLGKMEGA
jgi:hypothetical protein